jgi:hypothetical protein
MGKEQRRGGHKTAKGMEWSQGNCPNTKEREGGVKRGMMLGWTNRRDRKITKVKEVKLIKIMKSLRKGRKNYFTLFLTCHPLVYLIHNHHSYI